MKNLLTAFLLMVSLGAIAQDTTTRKSYKDLVGKWVEPKMQKDEYLEFTDSATLTLAVKGFIISAPYTADFTKSPIRAEATSTEYGIKHKLYLLLSLLDKDTLKISMSEEKQTQFSKDDDQSTQVLKRMK